ncbi:hypothetical protein [Halorarius litoreus]|uniref:hypothetical protein n=1 Tax=Halorarius litoreus TaxID=2962676 RepID=UPI0020CEFE3C|nr:hypothetical protein [Halorarius litoreus]
MNALRAGVAIVLGVAVLIAGAYAVFAFVLVSADQSTYTANTTAEYDYDAVIATAEAEGFTVRTEDASGFHPEGVDDLDAELGPEYEIGAVVYHHENGGQLRVAVFEEPGRMTELVYFGPDFEPVAPEDLPEPWLVDRITLSLGVDESTAQGYVDEMRGALTDDDVAVAQTYSDERLQFEPVYEAFEAEATPTVRTSGDGQGWVEYHYERDGTPIGELDFIVARAILSERIDGRGYTLNVDRVGGITVSVTGRAGAEIPDAELRENVRDVFEQLGIPAEAADDLEFEYDGSVW